MLIPEKYINVLEKDNNFWKSFELGGIDDTFKLREEFRRGISWHIPSDSLISELEKYQPIISVGSGHAYTEALAKERKIDIIATDIKPNFENRWCRGNTFYTSIEKISARNAVLKYKNRNVSIFKH